MFSYSSANGGTPDIKASEVNLMARKRWLQVVLVLLLLAAAFALFSMGGCKIGNT